MSAVSLVPGSTTQPLSPGDGSLRRPGSEVEPHMNWLCSDECQLTSVGKTCDKELGRCIGCKSKAWISPKGAGFLKFQNQRLQSVSESWVWAKGLTPGLKPGERASPAGLTAMCPAWGAGGGDHPVCSWGCLSFHRNSAWHLPGAQ